MRRFGLILFLSLLSLFPLRSQTPEEAKEELLAFSAKVSAIECDFVQTKTSTLLAEDILSSGHMSYRKPGYLSWSYLKPDPLTFLAEGERVTITRDGQETSLGGNQGRLVREMTRMIIGNIDGSVLSDSKTFKADVTLSDGCLVATLVPQKKELKRMWTKLVLYYDRSTMAAKRFEMHEASGDRTVITFTDIKYAFSE